MEEKKQHLMICAFFTRLEEAIVYTEIWKEGHGNSKAPKIMSSRNQLRADRNQLIRMPKTRIGFLRISPADNDEGYDSAPGRNM